MPRLDATECQQRFAAADHGVLGTIHPERGVDLVPVVFALVDGEIAIPVDRVKAKATTALQRLANIDADPRTTVLVEHYDADWRRLWWVRASGSAVHHPGAGFDEVRDALAERYPAYAEPDSIDRLITVTVFEWQGWEA